MPHAVLDNSNNNSSCSGTGQKERSDEEERKYRREIANSNERRRNQNINEAFEQLKDLIPHFDGERLSKAVILQQSAEYINSLTRTKRQLNIENKFMRDKLLTMMGGDEATLEQELNEIKNASPSDLPQGAKNTAKAPVKTFSSDHFEDVTTVNSSYNVLGTPTYPVGPSVPPPQSVPGYNGECLDVLSEAAHIVTEEQPLPPPPASVIMNQQVPLRDSGCLPSNRVCQYNTGPETLHPPLNHCTLWDLTHRSKTTK
eukprot:Nk52_evm53s1992 gene=Nk52_evmTU53s1992